MNAPRAFLSVNCARSVEMARRYSKKAAKTVKSAMSRRKRGALKSGRSGKTVRSRKQAIAIGLSEARRKGAKVPARKKAGKKK
jgi:hypothetical protein